MDINWSRTRTKRIASNTEPELGSLAEEREPERELEQLSDREYWQQEKEKAIWNLLIFFAAVVIVAIAVGTAAWFASNREVSGNNMAVVAKDGSYEIWVTGSNVGPAVVGDNAEIYDFAQNGDYARALTDGAEAEYSLDEVDKAGYQTSSANPRIKWRLESGNGVLGPDSNGVFTFYIVPKQTGTLTTNFKLNLLGYQADQSLTAGQYTIEQDSLVPMAQEDPAVQYLNGHIHFFSARALYGETGRYAYTVWRDKEGFTMQFEDAEENVPIQVDLYWIWANTFQQMVFATPADSSVPVAGDAATLAALQDFVATNPQMIFMSEEDITDKVTEQVEENTVFSSTNSITNIDELSLAYNKADQAIGTEVDYMLVVLTAVE